MLAYDPERILDKIIKRATLFSSREAKEMAKSVIQHYIPLAEEAKGLPEVERNSLFIEMYRDSHRLFYESKSRGPLGADNRHYRVTAEILEVWAFEGLRANEMSARRFENALAVLLDRW